VFSLHLNTLAEIQQQSNLDASSFQIILKLHLVNIGQPFHSFQLHYDLILNDKISVILSDNLFL